MNGIFPLLGHHAEIDHTANLQKGISLLMQV